MGCLLFSRFYCDPLLGRKGGELASAVHAYGKTGDPHMRALVQHILGLVSHPILNFLYRWIYDGELEDTYHEVRTAKHCETHWINPEVILHI